MFGFGLVAVVAAAALGVDYSRAVTARKLLANGADAAALAAASRLPDAAAARAAALAYIEKNIPSSEYGTVADENDVEVGSWDSESRTFTPATDPNAAAVAVRVTAHLSEARGNSMSMLFGAVLGRDYVDISASAVAGRGGPPCVIALDPTASASLAMRGSAKFKAISCGIQINSTASAAFEMKGSSELEATDICVGGSANVGGNDVQPSPREYCVGQADPLLGLAAPSYGGCDHNNASYKGVVEKLQPGVYCGGLSIDGDSEITLEDGIYIIKDGPLALKGSAKLSGDAVAFFLTGNNAVVNVKSKAQLDLAAPTTGSMKGMLFFQDRNYGGTHDWKGKAATRLKGIIYFPNGTLASKNDNAITPEDSCTVIIVNSMAFEANSGATVDLSSRACRGGLADPYSRGVVLLE